MKYLLILLLSLSFLACDDEEPTFSPAEVDFEWLVGNDAQTVEDTFDVPTATRLDLVISRNSLCPSHGVDIYVENDGEVLLNQVVEADEAYEIALRPSSQLIVRAEAVVADQLIDCVWLGNAKVKGGY